MDREEEISSIQAIYGSDFLTIDATHFVFHAFPVALSIYLPLLYPCGNEDPVVSLDSNGLGVSRLQLSQLQSHLQILIHSKRHVPGEPILFDITEETREFADEVRGEVSMEIYEEEEEFEDLYVEEEDDPEDTRIFDGSILRGHMGKTTIESIMAKLPPSLKLLHAEPILRSDLRNRYCAMRQKIQYSTSRATRRVRDAQSDSLGEEHVVFHGTMRHNVGSIVRSGFIVPGNVADGSGRVVVRCGSTWGQGIYTSPDPSYSLSYTDYIETNTPRLLPGQKLIVSVVVLGRPFHIQSYDRRLNPEVTPGYHSHVSPNKMEYVVFNSAQILPLYVLHLANQSSLSVRSEVREDPRMHAGHFTRLSMTDYARKYLPNGFGSASGKKFVVEEIAPVDDDEELWGEYQYEQGEFQEDRMLRKQWW